MISRRVFLARSAASAAAFTVIPSRLAGADESRSPNSRLALAGVGVGGVGFGQLKECAEAGFQIVALCDVDDSYAKKAYDHWPEARRYRDFREMLAAEGDRIDAVYCGTPDHTHALIVLAALRRRKHVCCVKPLTRTVHELRLVVKTAREAGVATQVTAAANTSEPACRACEWIASGALGDVRELHAWSNRPVWPQGMTRPPGEDPVPKDLDWKLWLGPAALRPFKGNWPADSPALAQMNLKDWNPGIEAVYHPFNFRGWWDFGTGALGDMGCHHFNTPFRALQLGSPARIYASATRVFAESAPLASIVTYDFPARDAQPPLRAVWYDGGLRPATPRHLEGRPLPDEGTLYVGEKGALLHTWAGLQVFPEALGKRLETVPRMLPRRRGTWGEWAEACRGGESAGCNFKWAEPLTEIVLLGNIAIRTGKLLEWDAARGSFTNSPEANRQLHDDYQNGWSLEAV
ncbi:MAG TPA: Gfo/Idh/MocA family oxidoreductase [Candidatus Paceibacterota bacterium]|nr:Gfo/Idh/MocA family oxidoreductase [Candidatus Paceibacterota bacterium]